MKDEQTLLWWVIPDVLAGMPMPFIHLERRLNQGGALNAYDDELPVLYSAGVRGIVSLLNIPSDLAIYQSAGFDFLCLPVPDGSAPTFEQALQFLAFVENHRAKEQPVAVHCEAGIGRTGTMIATYLIAKGESAEAAIHRVREVQRAAIETARQVQFLNEFAVSPRLPVF